MADVVCDCVAGTKNVDWFAGQYFRFGGQGLCTRPPTPIVQATPRAGADQLAEQGRQAHPNNLRLLPKRRRTEPQWEALGLEEMSLDEEEARDSGQSTEEVSVCSEQAPMVEACCSMPQHLILWPVGGGFEACCSMLQHTEN